MAPGLDAWVKKDSKRDADDWAKSILPCKDNDNIGTILFWDHANSIAAGHFQAPLPRSPLYFHIHLAALS
jgi:hypothetical protein